MRSEKRKKSVFALLGKSEKQLLSIRQQYQAALLSQEIPDDLRIDIKNYFENLKSSLDYLALDIRDSYCANFKQKDLCYFPLFDTEKEFLNGCQKYFPEMLNNHQEIVENLNSWQPYQPQLQWIRDFNKINNTNKHGDLIEQTRIENPRTHVTGAAGSIDWSRSGVTFSTGVSVLGVPMNARTQQPVENNLLTTTRMTWVDFKFDGFAASAIGLLNSALPQIIKVHNMFYQPH